MEDWGARDPRWAGIRTDGVEVGGTTVRTLRVDGPDHGIPQVLIHGLGGSATNWIETAVGLSAYGPVFAPDLPGFGRTPHPQPGAATVRANARFVSAFCRELGLDRVVLHGNSMGGMISILVAGHNRSLVERLVLVNPALPAPRTQVHKADPLTLLRFAPFVSPRLGARVMELSRQRLTAAQLYQQTIDLCFADPSSVREPLRELGVENLEWAREVDWRIPGFAEAATSVVKMVTGARTIHRAMDRIEAPTLLLWGAHDRLVARPAVAAAAARRPDWTYHEFEHLGHVPMLEDPDTHLEVVETWLQTTGIPRATGASASTA